MPDPLPDTALISRADNQPWCDLGTEVVVLRAKNGAYYRLASTARSMWLLLSEPRTIEQLLPALAEEYEAPTAVIEADARKFVGECAQLGLMAVMGDRRA